MAVENAPASAGITLRLARVATSLVRLHVDQAQREASRDLERAVAAFVLVCTGIVIMATAMIAFEASAVLALHQRGWRWLHAALVIGAADCVLAAACVGAGVRRVREPWLHETRALVRRTVDTLTGEE